MSRVPLTGALVLDIAATVTFRQGRVRCEDLVVREPWSLASTDDATNIALAKPRTRNGTAIFFILYLCWLVHAKNYTSRY